ncbi:MAG: hypothetical protein FKY71_20130 [Spiribacter salinus]|uniref:Uncharacterized protein n=1 Tax=Spiribacter salinus TaxID=1335746 RepID=A0A540V4K5_9GAMM|nr:MAG: hypothetical protein FKY71_20130 [Spiribacter salinus]
MTDDDPQQPHLSGEYITTQYIRDDLGSFYQEKDINALLAEAYEGAARATIAAGVRTYEANKERHPSHAAEAFDLCEEVAEAIRALTPTAALAAREARDKQVREQALRELLQVNRVHRDKNWYPALEQSILALIEGGKNALRQDEGGE